MNLGDMMRELGIEHITPELTIDPAREVAGGYVSDLLSDVLAHAPRGGVLVTVQVHMNVIAVAAAYAELACIVFAAGRRPEEAVRAKAVAEGMPLFVSEESAFDIVGKLYATGVRGNRA